MLVFLAAAEARVPDLRQAARTLLAWRSILDDRGEGALNLTPADVNQAGARRAEAEKTVRMQIGEAFCHILYPVQKPGEADIEWSAERVTGGGGLVERTVRKLEASEHLIPKYSGIRVRGDLDQVPLWGEEASQRNDHIGVADLWSYYCRYLYMPRLAGFGVLRAAVSTGAADFNWQNDAFAYAEAYDAEADRYRGLKAGQHVEVTFSRDAVLVHPDRAAVQLDAEAKAADVEEEGPPDWEEDGRRSAPVRRRTPDREAPLPTRFYGRVDLDPVRGLRDLDGIMDAVTSHLGKAGKLTLTLEINAESKGFDDRTRRIVGENAAQLGFDDHAFEE